MFKYIKAENLKCKKTFAKKLVIIAPLFMVLLAVISGMYFVQNGYNWWYVIILPGLISLMTALVNQYEDRKLRYRTVFALPVSLQKTWAAKVFLISGYTAVAILIHFVGIALGKLFYNPAASVSIQQMFAASLILLIVSLWQIPLCLFLSKKFGLLMTILLNIGGGIVLNIFTVSKAIWWVCPYSYATRLMCPVLGILPNGNLAPHGDALLNTGVIPIGIALSIALFAVLLAATSIWFSKQEVK
jgi:lantibiotic protection ABC transporter permease subunit, MutE/EpiE family